MKPIGFDSIVDELRFLDEAVLSVLPALVTHTDVAALNQEAIDLRRRVSIAAYNLASDLLTERRLRHQAILNQCARRTA